MNKQIKKQLKKYIFQLNGNIYDYSQISYELRVLEKTHNITITFQFIQECINNYYL